MNDVDQNTDKNEQPSETRFKINPRTGLSVMSGPSFTIEEVAKDFPVDCCRDAIILRRSVGLGKKDPFEENEELNFKNKEEVAETFPRDCCRFSRSIRRSVGLSGDGLTGSSDKCCFADKVPPSYPFI